MQALTGIRVLDMSRLLPGPYCTMLLADFGAEVIKIEEPGKGDYSRSFPPFLKDFGYWHLQLNRNKQSVVLDLKSEEVICSQIRDALKGKNRRCSSGKLSSRCAEKAGSRL